MRLELGVVTFGIIVCFVPGLMNYFDRFIEVVWRVHCIQSRNTGKERRQNLAMSAQDRA
jgi:hypothetical protein